MVKEVLSSLVLSAGIVLSEGETELSLISVSGTAVVTFSVSAETGTVGASVSVVSVGASVLLLSADCSVSGITEEVSSAEEAVSAGLNTLVTAVAEVSDVCAGADMLCVILLSAGAAEVSSVYVGSADALLPCPQDESSIARESTAAMFKARSFIRTMDLFISPDLGFGRR